MDSPTPVSDSVNICSYVRRKKILKNMHFLIYYIDMYLDCGRNHYVTLVFFVSKKANTKHENKRIFTNIFMDPVTILLYMYFSL